MWKNHVGRDVDELMDCENIRYVRSNEIVISGRSEVHLTIGVKENQCVSNPGVCLFRLERPFLVDFNVRDPGLVYSIKDNGGYSIEDNGWIVIRLKTIRWCI